MVLNLNLLQGAVSLHFSPEAARDLQSQIAQLVQHLKTNSQPGGGGRAKHPPLEYRYTGDVFLEVFCNPNIYPSPFAAKVLLTLRDDRIRLTSEAELTRLIEDLEQYLAQEG